MKTLAFCMALLIMAFGVFGIIMPGDLQWVALHAGTAGLFWVVAAVRVAFGLILISVARDSRAPKALRVVGFIVLIAGIGAALMAMLAMGQARAMIEHWVRLGPVVTRVTSVCLVVFAGFIACACAPGRKA